MTQLTVQQRMRPEIADLVRMPLYNELLDHASIRPSQYPHFTLSIGLITQTTRIRPVLKR